MSLTDILSNNKERVAIHKLITILKRVKAKYVLGLTATPIHRDGQQPIIFMQCGPIRHTAVKLASAPRDLEVIPQCSS